jgi:hypothetical protein
VHLLFIDKHGSTYLAHSPKFHAGGLFQPHHSVLFFTWLTVAHIMEQQERNHPCLGEKKYGMTGLQKDAAALSSEANQYNTVTVRHPVYNVPSR